MGYSKITEMLNKDWVRARFSMPNGQYVFKTCKYETNKTFKVKDCRYIVDPKAIHYDGKTPYIEYFYDNPNPITYTHSKNVWNGHVITSEIFNDAMESKVIKEMVSSGMGENLVLLILLVIAVLVLISIGASLGVFESKIVNATANMTANMTAPVIH